jgi:hypothetical protein
VLHPAVGNLAQGERFCQACRERQEQRRREGEQGENRLNDAQEKEM